LEPGVSRPRRPALEFKQNYGILSLEREEFVHSLTLEETQELESVQTFDELAELAISTLARMKCEGLDIVQICGPMSTGGCGNFQKNMARFVRSIEIAHRHGINVFNQVLFQEAVIRICSWTEGEPYPMDLLEVFYAKVLQSGYITKGLFLPDWESSVGARWEREFLCKLSISVEDYPSEWIAALD
jgi:hypothetical protein